MTVEERFASHYTNNSKRVYHKADEKIAECQVEDEDARGVSPELFAYHYGTNN